MFSIQIFQYLRQILPRVCTLVLFMLYCNLNCDDMQRDTQQNKAMQDLSLIFFITFTIHQIRCIIKALDSHECGILFFVLHDP